MGASRDFPCVPQQLQGQKPGLLTAGSALFPAQYSSRTGWPHQGGTAHVTASEDTCKLQAARSSRET